MNDSERLRNIVKSNGKTYFVSTANTNDRGWETMIFLCDSSVNGVNDIGYSGKVDWRGIFEKVHSGKEEANKWHSSIIDDIQKYLSGEEYRAYRISERKRVLYPNFESAITEFGRLCATFQDYNCCVLVGDNEDRKTVARETEQILKKNVSADFDIDDKEPALVRICYGRSVISILGRSGKDSDYVPKEIHSLYKTADFINEESSSGGCKEVETRMKEYSSPLFPAMNIEEVIK